MDVVWLIQPQISVPGTEAEPVPFSHAETVEPRNLDDLPRAYRIGLLLRELGADDELIGDCLGMDPAGVDALIEIGRQKAEAEQRCEQ